MSEEQNLPVVRTRGMFFSLLLIVKVVGILIGAVSAFSLGLTFLGFVMLLFAMLAFGIWAWQKWAVLVSSLLLIVTLIFAWDDVHRYAVLFEGWVLFLSFTKWEFFE